MITKLFSKERVNFNNKSGWCQHLHAGETHYGTVYYFDGSLLVSIEYLCRECYCEVTDECVICGEDITIEELVAFPDPETTDRTTDFCCRGCIKTPEAKAAIAEYNHIKACYRL